MDLFDLKSIAQESVIFKIPNDGSGLLLRLMEAPENCCIAFKMIRFSKGEFTNKNKCGFDIDGKLTVESEVALKQDGNWVIEPDNNFGLMVLPGTYRAVITREVNVGKVILEAEFISKEAVSNIPSHLRYGWINAG